MEQQRRHYQIEARLKRLASTHEPGELMPALHDLAAELLSSGYPRQELLQDFKGLVLELRADGREEAEGDVLEVMDTLTGWCSPSARL